MNHSITQKITRYWIPLKTIRRPVRQKWRRYLEKNELSAQFHTLFFFYFSSVECGRVKKGKNKFGSSLRYPSQGGINFTGRRGRAWIKRFGNSFIFFSHIYFSSVSRSCYLFELNFIFIWSTVRTFTRNAYTKRLTAFRAINNAVTVVRLTRAHKFAHISRLNIERRASLLNVSLERNVRKLISYRLGARQIHLFSVRLWVKYGFSDHRYDEDEMSAWELRFFFSFGICSFLFGNPLLCAFFFFGGCVTQSGTNKQNKRRKPKISQFCSRCVRCT